MLPCCHCGSSVSTTVLPHVPCAAQCYTRRSCVAEALLQTVAKNVVVAPALVVHALVHGTLRCSGVVAARRQSVVLAPSLYGDNLSHRANKGATTTTRHTKNIIKS